MPNNDILAIVIGVLVYGIVFGGLTVCIIIAMKKKQQ